MAVALLSQDGLVLSADLPAGAYPETFGMMCSTVAGAAGAACRELARAPPSRTVIQGEDSIMILARCGTVGLLAVVLDPNVEVRAALEVVARYVELFSSTGAAGREGS